jgi:hypothetical protein
MLALLSFLLPFENSFSSFFFFVVVVPFVLPIALHQFGYWK